MVKNSLLPSELIVPHKVDVVHTRESALKSFHDSNSEQHELNRIGGGNNDQSIPTFGSNSHANEMSNKLNTLYASGKVSGVYDNASGGNKRKTNKRKTNKRKINKRKTNKRKTNKRKINKRKANKRKTNKRKTNKPKRNYRKRENTRTKRKRFN